MTTGAFTHPYIAAVDAAAAGVAPEGLIQLALYAPGTVCYFAGDHHQQAARAATSLLVWLDDGGGWILIGPECLRYRRPHADLRPWQRAVDQQHWLPGTGLPADWRRQTRRAYWRLVPLLGLILQVEPGLDRLRAYLDQATTPDQPEFTPTEKRDLLQLLRARGGPDRAVGRDQAAWDQELKTHRRVLQRRRDCAFRLARLATLNLGRADQATVQSLTAANQGMRGEYMGRLSAKQEGLVGFLEFKYLAERTQAAEKLARDLAAEFGIEIPRWSKWRAAG